MSEGRRLLTAFPLLTPAEAVREIGGRRAVVQRWLRDQGLVRDIPGLGKRVSWREVLELVEREGGPEEPRPPQKQGKMPRVRLGERA